MLEAWEPTWFRCGQCHWALSLILIWFSHISRETHFSYRDRSERIMKILFSHVPLIFLVLSSKIIEGLFSRTLLRQLLCFPFLCSQEVPLLLRGSVYDSLPFTRWWWEPKLPLSFCQRIPNLNCVFKLPTPPTPSLPESQNSNLCAHNLLKLLPLFSDGT